MIWEEESPEILEARAQRAKEAERIEKYKGSLKDRLGESQRVIAIARKKRGWTQGQLAARLFVVHTAVSKYENGYAIAPWEDLMRVMPELEEMRKVGCHGYCPYAKACTGGDCKLQRRGRPLK